MIFLFSFILTQANDGYDSDNYKGLTADIDVAFKNLINGLYSKDTSKKVKTAKRLKTGHGLNINSFVPYGYRKSDEDKHYLVIDEPAAGIVARIFSMYLSGQKPLQIAKTLNSEGELTPSAYKRKNGSKLNLSSKPASLWSSGMVNRILHNEQYTGSLICNRAELSEIGGKVKVYKERASWTKIPNAHPVIIGLEIWNEAARIRAENGLRPHKKNDTNRLLYKRVRCGYCSSIMRYRADKSKAGVYYKYYYCETPRYTDEFGCTNKTYYPKEVDDVVKSVVKAQIGLLPDMEKLCSNKEKANKKSVVTLHKRTIHINQEIELLKLSKRTLYERYKLEKLDLNGYMDERKILDSQLAAKVTECDRVLSANAKDSKEIDEVYEFFLFLQPHKKAAELPHGLINSLVESVYIYDKDRIEIKFTFADGLEQVKTQIEYIP